MTKPRTPSQLLRDLLTIADSDAYVVPVNAEAIRANAIYHVSTPNGVADPTHAVFDADGEVLGRGLSEDAAIADAVASALLSARDAFDELHTKVGELRRAAKALGLLRD